MKKYKKYLIMVATLLVVIALDMITKSVFEGKYFVLIPYLINITSCHNTGAAFSIFSEHTVLLSIVTSTMIIAMVVYYVLVKTDNTLFQLSLSLIIAGALGNLYDRLFLGYVRDFVDLAFMDFAIFNVADISITFGIIILFVYVIFIEGKEKGKDGKNSCD